MDRDRDHVAVDALLAALDRPSEPSVAFAAGLESRLLAALDPARLHEAGVHGHRLAVATPAVLESLSRRADPTSAPWPPRRWSPGANAATAAILLLAVLGVVLSARFRAPTGGAPEPRPIAVYAKGVDGSLLRLDADTLATLPVPTPSPGGTPIAFGVPLGGEGDAAETGWTASADGSTLVRVVTDYLDGESVPRPRLVVFDGATGGERSRFELPFPFNVQTARLTGDGGRLIVREGVSGDDLQPLWHVIDTATGRELAVVRSDEPSAFPEYEGGLPRLWEADATGRRLYHLAAATARNGTAPVPMALIAYDLTTGVKVGSTALPGVLAGSSTRQQTVGTPASFEVEVEDALVPTLALSPVGRRLAVVNGDGTTVTLVEAETLALEKTIALDDSALTPVAELLERPSEGPDGGDEESLDSGRYLMPTFAADGRHLYLAGTGLEVSPKGRQIEQDLGLLRIDLETGSMVARARIGIAPWVVPSGDGSRLYALSLEREAASDAFEIVLRRLDPESLVTLAERRDDLYPPILVLQDRADREEASPLPERRP